MVFLKPKPSLEDGEIRLKLVAKHKDSNPDGWGQSFIYDIFELSTNRIVGRCDLRLGNTPTLALAGHIGYTVYVPYRGHHYAAKASKILFAQAKHMGMKTLIITCNTDNLASYRTCELAGCTYLCDKTVPPTHELYAQGDRVKAIFEKKL